MECYEGAKMIKTFRGMLADGTQDTILLHTNDGSTGYRIVKFELILYNPAGDQSENTINIWKTSAAAAAATKYINFSDNELLAAGYIENGAGNTERQDITIIFDKEIFNQDIYITNTVGDAASSGINYYLELEQVKLDINANTVATLKDMRNTASPRP
jgi:hypothetical protein